MVEDAPADSASGATSSPAAMRRLSEIVLLREPPVDRGDVWKPAVMSSPMCVALRSGTLPY
jgi:hypothetical protein